MAQAPDSRSLTDDIDLKVGDRVFVDRTKKGQIKWIGENKVLDIGKHYGVRLVEKRGTMNGTFKDIKFFWCPDNYGVLVPRRRITAIYTKKDFDFSEETEPIKDDPSMRAIRQRRKDIARMKEKFRAMDTDGNLLVDLKEFTKLVTGKGGLFPTMTTNEVKKLFDEIDVTKSTTISYAEFDAWTKSLGGIHVLEHKDFVRIREQFKEMDKDGDKQISPSEFQTGINRVFPSLNTADCEQLFKEIDGNGNGSISFNEYDAWVKNQEGGAEAMSKVTSKKK